MRGASDHVSPVNCRLVLHPLRAYFDRAGGRAWRFPSSPINVYEYMYVMFIVFMRPPLFPYTSTEYIVRRIRE